jgi:hypothetical protein
VSDALLKRWQETRALWSRYNLSAEMMQHYWKIIDLQLYNNILCCLFCCFIHRTRSVAFFWTLRSAWRGASIGPLPEQNTPQPQPSASALSGRYSIIVDKSNLEITWRIFSLFRRHIKSIMELFYWFSFNITALYWTICFLQEKNVRKRPKSVHKMHLTII